MKIQSDIGTTENSVGNWSLSEEDYEAICKTKAGKLPDPKSSHIKKTPFLEAIKSGLSKVTESMLPLFQRIKGAKEKISFYTYSDTCDDTRQIWENYKNIFRTVNQVHSLQHYLGAQVLQHILITNKGIPVSAFSQRIKDQEPIRQFEGKLERIREEMRHVSDRVQSGVVSEEKFEKEKRYWINAFETKEQKLIVARFLDYLEDSGEFTIKAKNRVAVRQHRKLESELMGLHTVGDDK